MKRYIVWVDTFANPHSCYCLPVSVELRGAPLASENSACGVCLSIPTSSAIVDSPTASVSVKHS